MDLNGVKNFFEKHQTLTAWGKLGLLIAIAVVVCFILLKLEKKLAAKWLSKHSGINARFTDRIIRFVIIFIATMWVIMSSEITRISAPPSSREPPSLPPSPVSRPSRSFRTCSAAS